MTVGEKIKELRKKSGISQEQLAEAVHVSRQTISSWEKGQKLPTKKNIEKVVVFFNIKEDYFFSGEENYLDSVLTSKEIVQNTLVPLVAEETAVAVPLCASSCASESGTQNSKKSKKKIIIASVVFILAFFTVFFIWLFDYLHYLEIEKEREEGWVTIETFTISTTDVPELIAFLIGLILVIVCGGLLIKFLINRKKEKKNGKKK